MTIRSLYTSISIRVRRLYDRARLKNKSFTIISNNCWGGFVYQKFGLGYQSPTIGLGIVDEDYFMFCENLKYYLSQPLVFIEPCTAKHYKQRRDRYKKEIDYPVAKLGDIEVWFTHYKSKVEAKEKWERRVKRMNWDKIIIKWSQRGSLDESLVKRFLNLPFKNKIAFVTKSNMQDEQIVIVPELNVLKSRGGGMKRPLRLNISIFLDF